MIEARRRRGWKYLYVWMGCWAAIAVVGAVFEDKTKEPREFDGVSVVMLLLAFAAAPFYWMGLYQLVKARGRPGSDALWGLLSWIGWIVIANLKDLAPEGEEPPPLPIDGKLNRESA